MKKYPCIVFIFLLAFSTLHHQNLYAQFWKKKSKKEVKKNQQVPKNKLEKEINVNLEEEFKIPDYPESKIKSSYRIDVFLPLNLNELVKNNTVSKKDVVAYQPYINFYEGIDLASTHLSSEKIKLDIFIHDVEDPNNSIDLLTKNKNLNQSDLIIGLVQSIDIPDIAGFAYKNKINFISSLSPSSANIQENPYFVLIQPTLSTHISHLCEYVKYNFNKHPKLILYKKENNESEALLQIKQYFASDNDMSLFEYSDTTLTKERLSNFLDKIKANVIFVPVLETEYAKMVLDTLSALGEDYKIEIFGMPSWKAIRNLGIPNHYPSLNVYYTTPFAYDDNTAKGQMIATEYKKKFGGNASEMVFRGYETLYWMANMLHKYGTVFNKHLSNTNEALFTPYEIKHNWDKSGKYLYLENKFLYLLQYNNGTYNVKNN